MLGFGASYIRDLTVCINNNRDTAAERKEKLTKTFREWQHPQPGKIRKCEHTMNADISNSDPLHSTLHHATKFQVMIIFSHFLIGVIILQTWSKPIMENFKVLWNLQKSAMHSHYIEISFMVLYITPPNFSPIAEILKEFKWWNHSEQIDGQTDRQRDRDRQTGRCKEWWQYPAAPMVAGSNYNETVNC